MPQITEFNAPQGLGLQPTEVGVESTAAAARRTSAFVSETAQAKKETGQRFASAIQVVGTQAAEWAGKQEISRGAAAYAGFSNAWTQKWHELSKTANPNDPLVAQRFQAELEGDLEKFKSGFWTDAGKDWAERHIAGLREHLYAKSTADRATAAGHARDVNAATTVNGLSNRAYWEGGSRAGLDAALKDLETSGLRSAVIEEGKGTIIQRAARGGIDQNAAMPDWTKEDKYARYIDGPVLNKLLKDEEHQKKLNVLTQKQTDAYTKQQNTQAVNEAVDQNRNNNTTFDPATNRYDIKPEFFQNAEKIRRMPEGEKTGQALLEWGQRQQDKKPPPVRSNPDVHTDLLERMITPTDNPTTETEIRLAAAKDQLSPGDTHKLIALNNALTKAPIRDPVFTSVTSAAKKLLGTDTVGNQRYSEFLADFIPKYLQLPQNERASALDYRNKESLVNQTMALYQRTPQQKMEQHINDKLGIAPTEPGTQQTPSAPVTVTTVREAQDLKPGTTYVTPDGRRFIR